MPDEQNAAFMQAGQDFGRLNGVVDYQDGAVVSRTLLKSESGNLTIFAFDKGEQLSEHTTPHDAIVWVIDGQVEVKIRGQAFPLEKGDFIRLPAQIPHAVFATEKMKMALVLLFG